MVVYVFCGWGLVLADSWHIETVDTIEEVSQYASIAIDSYDNPHICYYDHLSSHLKYTHWTSTAWEIQSVDTEGDGSW